MPQTNSGAVTIHLNQIEYAYAVEDFDPEAEIIKVYIPKLMGQLNSGTTISNAPIDKSVFKNSSACKVSVAQNISEQPYIIARVVDKRYHNHPWLQCNNAKYGTDNCPNRVHANTCHHPGNSILKPCYHDHWHYHFDNEKVNGGPIPAGAKLMVMFMDNNINDVWVTRFICHY